jgi:hypothetical protein
MADGIRWSPEYAWQEVDFSAALLAMKLWVPSVKMTALGAGGIGCWGSEEGSGAAVVRQGPRDPFALV